MVFSSFFTETIGSGDGVFGGVGAFSSTGDGNGGGILVPSVSEPNLKSRAGSWNRFELEVVALPPTLELVGLGIVNDDDCLYFVALDEPEKLSSVTLG